jgi:hypothetical protein
LSTITITILYGIKEENVMFENYYNDNVISLKNLALILTSKTEDEITEVAKEHGVNGLIRLLSENCKKPVATIEDVEATITAALDAHTATITAALDEHTASVEAAVTAALDAHTASVEAAITAAIDAHLAAEHDNVG